MEQSSKFLVVKCECGSEQKVFSKPAGKVKCHKCGALLAEPGGGKASIKGNVVKELK